MNEYKLAVICAIIIILAPIAAYIFVDLPLELFLDAIDAKKRIKEGREVNKRLGITQLR